MLTPFFFLFSFFYEPFNNPLCIIYDPCLFIIIITLIIIIIIIIFFSMFMPNLFLLLCFAFFLLMVQLWGGGRGLYLTFDSDSLALICTKKKVNKNKP